MPFKHPTPSQPTQTKELGGWGPGQHAGGGVVCLTTRVEVGFRVGCSRGARCHSRVWGPEARGLGGSTPHAWL